MAVGCDCARRFIPAICFPIFDGLPNFLVMRDPLEVGSFSRRANIEPVSVPLQHGFRFLQHPLPAAPSVGLATALPVRENIGLTTFRMSTSVG